MDQNKIYDCIAKESQHNGRDQWGCTEAESGIDMGIKLFWEPNLWSPSGPKRAGWVFGYAGCAKNYGSCDKAHHLTDQTCPPEGGYEINPSYNVGILDTGFLSNVYCSRGVKFFSANEFERKTKKNMKNLEKQVEESSHSEIAKAGKMKVVRSLVHISHKRVRKCARSTRTKNNSWVLPSSVVPDAITNSQDGIDVSGSDLDDVLNRICIQYDTYLEWRYDNSCDRRTEGYENSISRRRNRLRKRCKAYRRHRAKFGYM